MAELKCEECVYYWRERHEEYARCHFEPKCWEPAPCDEDYDDRPKYEVRYFGYYYLGDTDEWNTVECESWREAYATYEGMIGAGFPIDDICIEDNEYGMTYKNGDWY